MNKSTGRVAKTREGKKAQGYVRYEIWVRPEWKPEINRLIESLEKKPGKPG